MNCDTCVFRTNKTTNFRKHLNSFAHFNKCKLAWTCHYCLKTFTRKSGYSNHVKTCDIDLCPSKKATQLITQPAAGPIQPIVQTINNISIVYNNCKFITSIDDLLKDNFVTSNQKYILYQMQKEKETHEEIQRDLAEQGCNFLPYKISYMIYCDHVLKTLCKSTDNLVITHRDINIEGSNKELLFKHDGDLYADLIIRDIVKFSKYYNEITDFDYKISGCPREYKQLLLKLHDLAMRRKNEHNRNILLQNMKR
jgi:hypothetical protein